MFLGTYSYALDPKGRLFIPAKLRVQNDRTIERFVVTQGLEGCLYLYERNVFLDFSARLSELPVKKQSDGRAFRRLFLAGASESDLDPMGRLLIPKHLTAYARIRKETSIIGVGERIEIWAKETWNRYALRVGKIFHQIGDQLNI